jgi:ribosomal protein L21E
MERVRGPGERSRYELRLGGRTVATGLMDELAEFEVGDRVDIAGSAGIIRAIEPLPGGRTSRLVVDIVSPSAA